MSRQDLSSWADCDPSSTTIHEAQSSANHLQSLVIEVLEGNREMSRRLLNMEMQSVAFAPSKNSGALGESISVDSMSLSSRGDHESSVTVRKAKRDSLSEASGQLLASFKRSFDRDLQTSRPYIRASKNRESWSATSSAIRWSRLSGLSLSDISHIAVINLPISPRELSNGQHYSSDNSPGRLKNIMEEELPPSLPEPLQGKSRIKPLINIKKLLRQADTRLSDQGEGVSVASAYSELKDRPGKIVLLGKSLEVGDCQTP